MSRTALARKYRPRRFEQLVGQDHVASTLRSAVEGGRVAHAYLFCGPRGIGKTTTARVLAMALNCPDREDGEPCGVCSSCERIWSGRTSMDVVEIDAASNRGVDDARDLRERAMYAPSDDERYKVYILDEAHMLTREAWNALLKILEEPPSRVIFAFATTEPQKIEQTAAPVMSRCQRFDFRRVSVQELVGRLEHVVEAEGISAEEGSLLPIARQAKGGVRDALSLLDQVLSFTAEEVRREDVRRMLGLVEEERYLEFFDLAARGDRAGVFPFVQRLVDRGHDPAEFVRGLADALRVLLMLRLDPEAESVEMMAESRERFREAAERFRPVDLLRLLMAVSDFETSGRFRRSAQQRVQLEVLLLRLVTMDSAVELEELLRAAGGPVAEQASGTGGGTDGSASSGRPSRSGAAGGGDRVARGAEADEGAAGRTGREEGPGGGPAGESRGPSAFQGRSGSASRPSPDPDLKAGTATLEADPGSEERDGGRPSPRDVSLKEAWGAALREGDLPGEAVALRGARVQGSRDGEIQVEVHPGLAEDLQAFLDDPSRSSSFRSALANQLSVEPAGLSFQVGSTGSTERMTAETAREQRLREMMEADPTLREAVEELDLTIKE